MVPEIIILKPWDWHAYFLIFLLFKTGEVAHWGQMHQITNSHSLTHTPAMSVNGSSSTAQCPTRFSAIPRDTLSTVGATSAEQSKHTIFAISTKKKNEAPETETVAALHMPISWNDPPSPLKPSCKSKSNQCTYKTASNTESRDNIQHRSAFTRRIIQIIIERLKKRNNEWKGESGSGAICMQWEAVAALPVLASFDCISYSTPPWR